jgi:hypothetical protein
LFFVQACPLRAIGTRQKNIKSERIFFIDCFISSCANKIGFVSLRKNDATNR